jgi:hypothetical protein
MVKTLKAESRKYRLSGNFHPDTSFFLWGHSCTICLEDFPNLTVPSIFFLTREFLKYIHYAT